MDPDNRIIKDSDTVIRIRADPDPENGIITGPDSHNRIITDRSIWSNHKKFGSRYSNYNWSWST